MNLWCAAPTSRGNIFLIKMAITVSPFLAPPPSRNAEVTISNYDFSDINRACERGMFRAMVCRKRCPMKDHFSARMKILRIKRKWWNGATSLNIASFEWLPVAEASGRLVYIVPVNTRKLFSRFWETYAAQNEATSEWSRETSLSLNKKRDFLNIKY